MEHILYTSFPNAATSVAAVGPEHAATKKFENQGFDIAGAKSYSGKDLAALLTKVSGKHIIYKDVTPAELTQSYVAAGFPDFVAGMFVTFEQAVKNGDASNLSGAVEKLSGVRAKDLEEFVRANFGK